MGDRGIRRLCFVFETPVLRYYRDKYGFDTILKNNYQIVAIDIARCVNQASCQNAQDCLEDMEGLTTKICREPSDFQSLVSSFGDETVLLLTFNFSPIYFFVYRAITRYDLRFGYLNQETTFDTDFIKSEKRGERAINYLKGGLSLRKLKNSILIRIPQRWYGFKYAEFIVLGGKKNSEWYKKKSLCHTNTIEKYIFTPDYEHFSRIKDKPRLIGEEYWVFIDQYLPYHPDGEREGLKIDGEKYYGEMSAFFDYVSESRSVKIVIAAHPRSNLERYPDCIKKYDIVKGKTAELIRYSERVMVHQSTAVSFAVLADKPMTFLTNNAIIRNYGRMDQSIRYSAKYFHTSVINTSDKNDWNLLNLCSDEAYHGIYSDYIQQYLNGDDDKDKSEERRFWDLFIEFVRELG